MSRSLSLADLPIELLLEIFEFATYVHESESIVPLHPFTPKHVSANAMGPNTPTSATRTKCALVLVCRSWRKLALQFLYRHIPIRSPKRAELLLRILQPNPNVLPLDTSECGQFTRHIEISTHVRGSDTIQFLQTVFKILRCCPNVRILSGTWDHPLPDTFLTALTLLYGQSLHALYWEGPGSTAPITFFSSFQMLKALDIHNVEEHSLPDQCSLPLVQDLIVSNSKHSLKLATSLKLPSLHNLIFKSEGDVSQDALEAFLDVHGPSLLSVDILPRYSEIDRSSTGSTLLTNHAALFLNHHYCPNLQTIIFDARTLPFDIPLDCPVRSIGLRGIKASELYPNSGKPSNVRAHLKSLIEETYPYLETVRAVEFLVESDSDSLIKDIFIWWTEKFERRGVDLQDAEGVVWAYMDDVVDKQEEIGTTPWSDDFGKHDGIVQEPTGGILKHLIDTCKI